MEIVIKIAAAALLGTCVALLLRRSNPELAVPLGAAVCVFSLFALSGVLRPIRDFLDEVRTLSGLSSVYFLPVLKCVAIGIAAKVGADLCRDGGQSAMAGAVELGGAAAALFVSLPLVRSFLALLQKLL